jgi:single-stranded-DNA-specific exonuclease
MPTDFIERLLRLKGLVDPFEREKFLNPSYEEHMHDPFLMPDMEKALIRIFEAMQAGKKIVVYSDYDCDGIPGAVVIHDLFKKIGYTNFQIYIPDRHDEGYGLNHDAIEQFIADGVNLLITIDLGSSDVEDVTYAEANGINVIITDHHLPPATLPPAFAIVNPKVPGSVYPDPMLCGAGVMFKLVQGFIAKYGEFYKIPKGWEKWLLDMAGLATLSDMVPLRNENRVIASYGLRVLRKSPRPGIQMLLRKLAINQAHLTEDDVAFMITPRINAASRMDSPMRAFELLATKDETEAGVLVNHLEKINNDRKKLVAQIMKTAYARLEEREMRDVIVIGDPDWRVGVLGLIAGKLVEEFKKPAFVWGREGANGRVLLKGSCRSDGSVNIVELMRSLPDSFVDMGGHELAGGFSVTDENIHTLEERLSEKYKELKRSNDKRVSEDADIDLGSVTEDTNRILDSMAPYGCDNSKPIFSFKRVTIESSRQFGKEKNHLELIVSDGKNKKKCIAFFSSGENFGLELALGDVVTVVGTIEKSYFLNRPELRIRILDIVGS